MRVEIGNDETIRNVTRFMWECLRRRPDYRSEFVELSKKYTGEIKAMQRYKPGEKVELSFSSDREIAWFRSRWRVFYPKDFRQDFDENKDHILFLDGAVGIAEPLWMLRYRTVLDTLAFVETLMTGERRLKDTRTGKTRRVHSYAEAFKSVRDQEGKLARAMKNRESKYGRNITLALNVDSYPFDETLSVAFQAIRSVKNGAPRGRIRIPGLFELEVYEMWQQGVYTLSQIADAFSSCGVSSGQRVSSIVKRIEVWMARVAPWEAVFMRRT